MNELSFIKMQGAGNDYIYIDSLESQNPTLSAESIQKLSDRRFGVGGDGVVIIGKSDRSDAKMAMWNADGSSSAMCGNALRCIAWYLHTKTGEGKFTIESDVGVHRATIHSTDRITVDMGRPYFKASEIPFTPDEMRSISGDSKALQNTAIVDYPFYLNGSDAHSSLYKGTLVSMGNPHCVIFVDSVKDFPVTKVGPILENHKFFPQKANIEFVEIMKNGEMIQRTWERGSGETMACGSGACAVLAASVVAKNLPKKNKIHLLGGELEAEWLSAESGEWSNQGGSITLTGAASIVFRGSLDLDRL